MIFLSFVLTRANNGAFFRQVEQGETLGNSFACMPSAQFVGDCTTISASSGEESTEGIQQKERESSEEIASTIHENAKEVFVESLSVK